MRKSDSYMVFFAAVVCLVCSLLLALASSGLKEQQEKMVALDRKLNVLKAFQYKVSDDKGKRIGGDVIEKAYANHVREKVLDPDTGAIIEGKTPADYSRDAIEARKVLPLYLWDVNGQVEMYAFPVSGQGLWSTIYGYLALNKDLKTIAGITFYKNGETPGLGGEVASNWFQKQFAGKKIYEDGHLLPLEVVKGIMKDKYPDGNDHAVDGISGATLTGNGLNQFLNADIRRYDKYFSKLRGS